MMRFVEKAILAVLCGASMGAVLLLGLRLGTAQAQDPAVPELLRARRVEIVDANGATRATLGVDDTGAAGLTLRDPAGAIRASLTVAKDGTPAYFQDRLATAPAPAPAGDPAFTLVECKLSAEMLGDYLVGTVKNTGGAAAAARLAFDLLDAGGKRVGTAETTLPTIAAGKSAKFRLLLNYRNVRTFAVTELRAE